ncbi:TPA: hypothetical protein ACXC99_003638 [Clostridium botulinum]
MKKLYKFYWDCGRQGDVEGMFIADEKEIEGAIDEEVYFGEILGKHSEVYGTIEQGDIEEIKVSQTTVKEMEEIIGSTISGYNPLNYIQYVCCECGDKCSVSDVTWYVKDNGDKVCEYCATDIGKEQLTELD